MQGGESTDINANRFRNSISGNDQSTRGKDYFLDSAELKDLLATVSGINLSPFDLFGR